MVTKFIGEGLNGKINSPNTNVLNVLRALVEDKDSTVYISNSYVNGSTWSSSGDPRVHFLPTDCGKKITVVGIQSNEERFNFSLNGIVDVLVEYPREDGTVELKDKKVFRTYNIIRDGELTMDSISAKLSEDSFNKLREIGILYYNGVKVPENHDFKPDYVYRIELTSLPLISCNWAQPVHIGLYELMIRENYIANWVKIAKKILKDNPELASSNNEESDFYTEQTAGSYEKTENLKEVDCIQYTIKSNEKAPLTDEEIMNYFEELINFVDFPKYIKELNKQLKDIRFKKRCIVYAIENTAKKGSYEWSDMFAVPRSKNKMRQEAEIEVNGQKCILQRTVYKKEV